MSSSHAVAGQAPEDSHDWRDLVDAWRNGGNGEELPAADQQRLERLRAEDRELADAIERIAGLPHGNSTAQEHPEFPRLVRALDLCRTRQLHEEERELELTRLAAIKHERDIGPLVGEVCWGFIERFLRGDRGILQGAVVPEPGQDGAVAVEGDMFHLEGDSVDTYPGDTWSSVRARLAADASVAEHLGEEDPSRLRLRHDVGGSPGQEVDYLGRPEDMPHVHVSAVEHGWQHTVQTWPTDTPSQRELKAFIMRLQLNSKWSDACEFAAIVSIVDSIIAPQTYRSGSPGAEESRDKLCGEVLDAMKEETEKPDWTLASIFALLEKDFLF